MAIYFFHFVGVYLKFILARCISVLWRLKWFLSISLWYWHFKKSYMLARITSCKFYMEYIKHYFLNPRIFLMYVVICLQLLSFLSFKRQLNTSFSWTIIKMKVNERYILKPFTLIWNKHGILLGRKSFVRWHTHEFCFVMHTMETILGVGAIIFPKLVKCTCIASVKF